MSEYKAGYSEFGASGLPSGRLLDAANIHHVGTSSDHWGTARHWTFCRQSQFSPAYKLLQETRYCLPHRTHARALAERILKRKKDLNLALLLFSSSAVLLFCVELLYVRLSFQANRKPQAAYSPPGLNPAEYHGPPRRISRRAYIFSASTVLPFAAAPTIRAPLFRSPTVSL